MLSDLRHLIETAISMDQSRVLQDLRQMADLSEAARAEIAGTAADLVRDMRNHASPGLMEIFLAEYGLSSDEGVALMCLAEALLRVPDAETIDALIEDKIAPSDWGRHLGHSTSPLVNASTWALMLTGKVLEEPRPGALGVAGLLRGAVKRLGEPVIRAAVGRAMREMGAQFVLGEDIDRAMARGAVQEKKGNSYSYDMLGEAAHTAADAQRYFHAYSGAIKAIGQAAQSDDLRKNPGISVKLSALHPRYDTLRREQVLAELAPRLQQLCQSAKDARVGLNIDAEEADRLDISLDVIEAVLRAPSLVGWEGFGVVVQAYGPRAAPVLDWLYALTETLDRRVMVRLVKGAYWDSEIKTAQVLGLERFPVFTTKAATDLSYIANARKLLGMTRRIYPQFATHNAHTAAAILHISADMGKAPEEFEFQRLHGMGETLHDLLRQRARTRCRIYAPVGAHRDLLAYLVRRLLENGANSSFVNQVVDTDVPPEMVARDPFDDAREAHIPTGQSLFLPVRANSRGFDLRDRQTNRALDAARKSFQRRKWSVGPILADQIPAGGLGETRISPSDPTDQIGHVLWARPEDITRAAGVASRWDAAPQARSRILIKASEKFETHFAELFALLHREAGKTLPDCVAELREAVDFLRYYAGQAEGAPAHGVVACVSPWNFPLAIFTGQIAAALAAGNAVLAKPAEQTPLIAGRAVQLLHEAGVPRTALQLLPGAGDIGAALTACPQVDGVAFTGSTETARRIHAAMADNLAPGAPLIAETGGLNAMIVDSTALPEQAVEAIVESAFQSAGQRCSALRCLYVQEDIADDLLTMLKGAMDCLTAGAPWDMATDLGPVIDAPARAAILEYIQTARKQGRVLHAGTVPNRGHFVAPTLIKVTGIADLEREVFGPVLHVATFAAQDLAKVIADINASGYGLTFGLMTRIDDRVQMIADRVQAGNIYINRNQIGAIVGSQPFGGEGLSGTGPKAGGPLYVDRFRSARAAQSDPQDDPEITGQQAQNGLISAQALDPVLRQDLPGPTGEANQYITQPRAPALCLGPGRAAAEAQVRAMTALGGAGWAAMGEIAPEALTKLEGFGAVIWWGDRDTARALRRALAARPGPILPLITGLPDRAHARAERHICIDTTASGGNPALLAGA